VIRRLPYSLCPAGRIRGRTHGCKWSLLEVREGKYKGDMVGAGGIWSSRALFNFDLQHFTLLCQPVLFFFFFLALGSEIYLSLQLLAIFGKPSHYLLKYCSFLILSSLPSHYLSCFLDIMSGPWQRELAPSPAMSGYWVAYFSCGLWDYLLCRYLGTHDCLFFFFLLGLGFELRASLVQSRHSTA
jgi:hypothetical protein